MRKINACVYVAAALASLSASLGGCDKMAGWFKPKPPPPPSAQGQPATRPAVDPATLKTENDILRAERDELRIRERQLSVQLRDLKFVGVQQEKQIKVLADAPVERDFYMAEVDKLLEELARLRKRINDLKPGSEKEEKPADAKAAMAADLRHTLATQPSPSPAPVIHLPLEEPTTGPSGEGEVAPHSRPAPTSGPGADVPPGPPGPPRPPPPGGPGQPVSPTRPPPPQP